MAANPSMVEIPGLPPPQPAEIVCPSEYTKHKTACFKFGSHSSYEMAQVACETVGARLANIEPVFSKYIQNQVRTMGGNDFWIGSFINRGKTYRKKGRTSCPIMRGQMINDALYGLVDCNSANRFICQKFGPPPQTNMLGMGPVGPNGLRPGLPTTAKATTTTEEPEDAEGGGLSPVIYVVITAVILIVAMIALKLLIGRYFRDKKKSKSPKNATTNEKPTEDFGGGKVFSPKWRTKSAVSKATSVDSAVPPSNPSPGSEKKYGRPPTPKQNHKADENEMDRMGRPRVNGPQPTRKPPHMNGEILHGYHGRTMDKNAYGRDHRPRKHRRTHSDPRSDYAPSEYGHRRRHSKRRHSYYSEHSQSTSDSDSDNSSYSGPRYGPTKVYQRHPSRSQMTREPMHYHIDPTYYRGLSKRDSHDYRERRHRSRHRSYGQSNQGHFYNMDSQRQHSRHISRRESNYGREGNYGKNHNVYGEGRRSHVPTVSGNVYAKQPMERQYFPQPHRLMSWASPAELKEFNNQSDEGLVKDTLRSFPREPIRVSRQIHQNQKKTKNTNKIKKSKKSKTKNEDDHMYETLDEMKRNKMMKKSAHKNKRKRSDARSIVRGSESRMSSRSVVSIQSRKLPTPPI